MRFLNSLWLLLVVLVLSSCGGSTYVANPTDKFVKDMMDKKTFSIVLSDMDVEGTFFKSYQHKYTLISESNDGDLSQEETEWIEVSEKYFWAHENNLGMELVSKGDEGKINKSVGPAGYNSYIGNTRYGSWQTSPSGGSFWAFYGQYMFMSNLFGLNAHPARRGYYNDYYSNYRGRKSYYGPKESSGKGSYYGTYSSRTKNSRPNFFQRQRTRSGWSSSSSKVGRSGSSWRGGRGSGFGK